MKKIIISTVFLVVGAAFFVAIQANIITAMQYTYEWDSTLGKYGTVLKETGSILPLVIAAVWGLFGSTILVSECLKKS